MKSSVITPTKTLKNILLPLLAHLSGQLHIFINKLYISVVFLVEIKISNMLFLL